MTYRERFTGVATLVTLVATFATSGVLGALPAPGTPAVTAVTRQNNGDIFSAPGNECGMDTCVGLSSGTAAAAPVRPANGRACTCQCLDHLPAYRDDLRICVDDIHECALAPFVSGSTSQQIPFVFLPLKGQIVHPSKEISFAGVKTPVCAVSGAQFLTDAGWIELRSVIDNDVPFRLFRDEGRTFLQWLGDAELRAKMAGRLILVQMLCKDIAKDPSSIDLSSVFTPCVAFKVAGTPSKYVSNITEVIFSADAHAATTGASEGLSVSEYVAIGICSVLLGLIYVASVFLYLHIRRRRRKGGLEKDVERRDDQSLTPGDEGIIKNNPLLSLGRHFTGPETAFSDSGSSENDTAPELLHQEEPRKKAMNVQVTSAIIHPLNDNFSMSLCSMEPVNFQDSSSNERHPEENVSIVETLEGREERPETVKTIVNATARRKLYFNPAYFEPHLLMAPPPAAIEFLTKIREVISIAKHKMSSKRFAPSLLGIPEEESQHEIIYEYPMGAASSRRSSMISLKRVNSRRNVTQCSGCPGCEPNDLKSLCGKLPEFPSIAVCQTCCRSSVSESKQQSIRKWLEDVPVLKQSTEETDDNETVLLKSLTTMSMPGSPNSRRSMSPIGTSHSIAGDIRIERVRPQVRIEKKRDKASDVKLERAKSPGVKKSPKAKAPPPPKQNPKVVYQAIKKSNRQSEDINPNISHHYDVIRNVRSPSPKLPDMINEAREVDKVEEVPQITKQKMAAVINEFTTHVVEPKPLNAEVLKKKLIDYEADSLERNAKQKNGYCTPEDYADISSSQPSPTLSSTLPLDEEIIMKNDILNIKRNSPIKSEDEHDYELIVLKKQKPVLVPKMYHLPELLQRNSGYNLVSEVYVNNGYNFGSTPSSPNDSNASTLEDRKPKIRYSQPDEKPGHLTIEVEDCPDNYIRVNDSDSFEPDTLDRKPTKLKSNSSDGNCTSDYIDSLERPRQILLKSTGSFKSDTLNNSADIGNALNSNFNRSYGSLREIYEAKTRNYLRPSLDNISFTGPINEMFQKTLSWNKYKNEEGKILTLDERQKKRQRQSPSSTVRQIPPDVVPSPDQSPIYERPKPPRKVEVFKPPLPPKNGNGRSTSMKRNSTDKKGNDLSPFSTISLPNSPSGVSANSSNSSDNEHCHKQNQDNTINILNDFIHSDDVVFKNGVNNQFILHASSISHPTFDTSHLYSNLQTDNFFCTKDIDKHMRDKNKSDSVKKTWRKLVDSNSTLHKDDSGYLSTDSSDSRRKRKEQVKEPDKESETDESSGDGHSESGAESIETHSVFFGTYRKFARVTESIDSGMGSDRHADEVVLLGQAVRNTKSSISSA